MTSIYKRQDAQDRWQGGWHYKVMYSRQYRGGCGEVQGTHLQQPQYHTFSKGGMRADQIDQTNKSDKHCLEGRQLRWPK